MKVLWITNIILPPLADHLKKSTKGSGGWMSASIEALRTACSDITFAVASCGGNGINLKKEINGVIYYLIPFPENQKRYVKEMESYWQEIKSDFQPDIVHIHGSEYTHGLAYIRACGSKNVILSLQGLISVIVRYQKGGISEKDARNAFTLYDLRAGSINGMDKFNDMRIEMEHSYFRALNHVIGRTSWDRKHVKTINPNINYHFCNETLRSDFYDKSWSLERCKKHSIFLSSAAIPLKGAHKVFEALPYILQKFPDTVVYVAGRNIMDPKSIKDWLKLSGYGNYLRKLIKKLKIANHIKILGLLDSDEMVNAYLNCHVFVCPSSIENSPNSLGEAQLLGVPSVASYVGGVSDFIEHGKTGFIYRFEEVELLADYVCRIFANDQLAKELSESEKIVAKQRHDKALNVSTTLSIYNNIINNDN